MRGQRVRILELPTGVAVTRIARGYLGAAARALRQLERRGNEEALHAFRVAIRRLRSQLRAYRPWLGKAAGRKVRRGLRRLTRATNEARDADVALAWIAPLRPQLLREERPGFDWLRRRLAKRRKTANRSAASALGPQFADVARRLHKRMNGATIRAPDAYRDVFLELLAVHAGELRERLAAIAASQDDRDIHRARIQVKRLRYLIEPLRSELDDAARSVVKRLKKIQNLLGELHDMQVLQNELVSARSQATLDRALGIAALSAHARERRLALLGQLRRSWLADGNRTLDSGLRSLAAAASSSRASQPRSQSAR